MEHPLIPSLDELTEQQLLDKITELNKKLGIAYNTGNGYLCNQIRMAIESYQTKYQEKLRKSPGTEFNDIIDISSPIAKPVVKVVEMPATTPPPPKNFYSDDAAKNSKCCAALATNQNYYFRVRAGYQHVNHGDNNDTWFASAKFYARPDALRERAGKNAWLIPDAEAELAHEYLAKPDDSANPGSGEGISFRTSFFWPWMRWTCRELCRKNEICPFTQKLAFGFGPTANVGFEQLFDGSEARLARYFGARLTINRDGYIEYTAGGTDGLSGTRQQIAAELPIYQSRDREVRYVLRGLWNTGSHNTPDVLQGGIFVEMPLGIFTTPEKWRDLLPFRK